MFRHTVLTSLVTLFLLISFLATGVAGQKLPEAKLSPVPTLERHLPLLKDAIRLHDRGDYDGAIKIYLEVLGENPHDVVALYELSYSYFGKHDYQKSLEIAFRGAQYKSEQLSGFYVAIGNSLDNLGDRDAAIKAYKSGIKQFPNDSRLHYNLGVTYVGIKKLEEARKSFKEAVTANPSHSSSHFALARLYEAENYRIPALLAVARFLILEPDSDRSGPALQQLAANMHGGVSTSPDQKNIPIFIDPSPKTDEGDFSAINLGLSLLSAVRPITPDADKTEARLALDEFSTFLSLLAETSRKKQSGFAWNYYLPYFVELKSRNFVEPFLYHTHQSKNLPEVSKWLTNNRERVNDFLTWSTGYQWYTRK